MKTSVVFMDIYGSAKIVHIPENAMSIIVFLNDVDNINMCKVRFFQQTYDEQLLIEDYNK